mmetsp:Transcript_121431/g.338944  ORF Transcript_121431/g.338944 Transcript_121431/m.338944 type:complete len:314 (-) Transcript_121431:248-1189(-)
MAVMEGKHASASVGVTDTPWSLPSLLDDADRDSSFDAHGLANPGPGVALSLLSKGASGGGGSGAAIASGGAGGGPVPGPVPGALGPPAPASQGSWLPGEESLGLPGSWPSAGRKRGGRCLREAAETVGGPKGPCWLGWAAPASWLAEICGGEGAVHWASASDCAESSACAGNDADEGCAATSDCAVNTSLACTGSDGAAWCAAASRRGPRRAAPRMSWCPSACSLGTAQCACLCETPFGVGRGTLELPAAPTVLVATGPPATPATAARLLTMALDLEKGLTLSRSRDLLLRLLVLRVSLMRTSLWSPVSSSLI